MADQEQQQDPYAAIAKAPASNSAVATPDDPYASIAAPVKPQQAAAPAQPTQSPAPVQQTPTQYDSTLGAIAHGFGLPTSLSEVEQRAQQFMQHPVRNAVETLVDPTGVLRGAQATAKDSVGEATQAIQAGRQGDPYGAIAHAIQAVPIVGPVIRQESDRAPGSNATPEERDAYGREVVGSTLAASAQAAPAILGGWEGFKNAYNAKFGGSGGSGGTPPPAPEPAAVAPDAPKLNPQEQAWENAQAQQRAAQGPVRTPLETPAPAPLAKLPPGPDNLQAPADVRAEPQAPAASPQDQAWRDAAQRKPVPTQAEILATLKGPESEGGTNIHAGPRPAPEPPAVAPAPQAQTVTVEGSLLDKLVGEGRFGKEPAQVEPTVRSILDEIGIRGKEAIEKGDEEGAHQAQAAGQEYAGLLDQLATERKVGTGEGRKPATPLPPHLQAATDALSGKPLGAPPETPAAVSPSGDATAAKPNIKALASAAIAAVPPRPTSKPPQAQPNAPDAPKPVLHASNDVEALRASAERQAPKVGDALAEATQGVPGAKVEAVRDSKDSDRITDKADRQGVDPNQIGDIAAAKVVAPNQQAADQVLENLHQRFPVESVTGSVDGEPGKNGVQQVQAIVNIAQPGEPVKRAEVLVQTPEMAKATDQTHDDYRKAQELRAAGKEEEAKALEAKIQKVHEAAQQGPYTPKKGDRVQMSGSVPGNPKSGTVTHVDPKNRKAGVKTDDGRAWPAVPLERLRPEQATPAKREVTPEEYKKIKADLLARGVNPADTEAWGTAYAAEKAKVLSQSQSPSNQGGKHEVAQGGTGTGESGQQPEPVQQGQPAPGESHPVGAPIPKRVAQIKELVAKGQKVVIFSAEADNPAVHEALASAGLGSLPVTNIKGPDFGAILDNDVNVTPDENERMDIPYVAPGKSLYVDFDDTLFYGKEDTNGNAKPGSSSKPAADDEAKGGGNVPQEEADGANAASGKPAAASGQPKPDVDAAGEEKPLGQQGGGEDKGKEEVKRKLQEARNRLMILENDEADIDQEYKYRELDMAEDEIERLEKELAALESRPKPSETSAQVSDKNEPTKYKFGNTQADIPPDSDAGKALARLRAKIDPADLMPSTNTTDGSGLEEDSHITIRYGIDSDDTTGLRAFLEKQAPFEATLGKVTSFPPSEHSDGAAPIVVAIESADLRRLEKELDQHGKFIDRTFPDYKPHATLGYVKPDAAKKYVGMGGMEGKKFTVSSVSISNKDGSKTEVQLKGKPKPSFYKPPTPQVAPMAGTSPMGVKPKAGPGEAFKRAVQAKADKFLDTQVRRESGQVLTRREIINERMAGGGATAIKQVQDDAAERKLDREIGAMRKAGVPTGNEMHPKTIKYREMLAQQKAGIKVPSHRITDKDGNEYIISKTEHDYAASVLAGGGTKAAVSETRPAKIETPLDKFEKDGGAPYEVTQKEWVAFQRAHRAALGQSQDSGTRYAPNSDYESYHEDSVKTALRMGLKVPDEVLKDYPDLLPKTKEAPKAEGDAVAPDTAPPSELEGWKKELSKIESQLNGRDVPGNRRQQLGSQASVLRGRIADAEHAVRVSGIPLTKPDDNSLPSPHADKWKYQSQYFIKALEPVKQAWLAAHPASNRDTQENWDFLKKNDTYNGTGSAKHRPEAFPDDFIRIEVPGDGKFLVKNSPAAIDKLLKSAPKAFAKPTETAPGTSKRSIPRAPKQEEIETAQRLVAHFKGQIEETEQDLRRARSEDRQFLQETLDAAKENLANAEEQLRQAQLEDLENTEKLGEEAVSNAKQAGTAGMGRSSEDDAGRSSGRIDSSKPNGPQETRSGLLSPSPEGNSSPRPGTGDSPKVKPNLPDSGTLSAFGFLNPATVSQLFPGMAGGIYQWAGDGPTPGKTQQAIMREERGQMDRRMARALAALEQESNAWDKRPRADFLAFADAVEHVGGKTVADLSVKDQQLAGILEKAYQERKDYIDAMGFGPINDWIDNYFAHWWERPSLARKKIKKFMGVGKRPLEGKASFRKQRKIPTTRDGIDIGLTPATWNPVSGALMKIYEMDQFIMAHQVLKVMKDSGTAKFVRAGADAPEGWTKLDDKIGTVWRRATTIDDQKVEDATYDKTYMGGKRPIPSIAIEDLEDASGKALVITGHYWAPADAAKVFNNFVSKGLAGRSAIFDALRWANNNLNALQLGISAFHATVTTVNAAASDVALGVEQLFQGKPVKAAGNALAGIALLPSLVRTIKNGWKATREYMKPGTYPEMEKEADWIARSGGRLAPSTLELSPIRKAINAWNSGTNWDKAKSLPSALLQAGVWPVLGFWVPKMKIGAFYLMAHNLLEEAQKKNWTPEKLRERMQEAWDAVDDRFGQIVYENRFWPRGLKDALQLTFRAVGYTNGDVRIYGGAIVDTAKAAGLVATGHGKEARITPKMSFALSSFLCTAILGASGTFMCTGHLPKKPLDYLYIEDSHGIMHSIAGYADQIVSFVKHPEQTAINKIAPLWNVIGQAINNQDFYRTEIRHTDDSAPKQAEEFAGWAAKQELPFSATGAAHLLEERGAQDNAWSMIQTAIHNPALVAESFFGFNQAPAFIHNSDALNKAREYSQTNRPAGTRTKEQTERSRAMHVVEDLIRAGKTDKSVEQAYKTAGVLSEDDLTKARFYARRSPLLAAVNPLHVDQAINVYIAATPEEKKEIRPEIERKQGEIDSFTNDPEERAKLKKAYQDALNPKPKFKGKPVA